MHLCGTKFKILDGAAGRGDLENDHSVVVTAYHVSNLTSYIILVNSCTL